MGEAISDKEMKPLPYIFCLVAILLMLLSSCGTRKSALDLEKVRTHKNSEVVTNIKNDITTNARFSKVANTLILTPIDPDKESTYTTPQGETTTFRNATLEIGKELANTVITKEDVSTLDLLDKSFEKSSSKSKTKDTESDKGNPWFWLGFFAFLIVVGYLVYKRFVR
jgi:hypothetical protein